MNSLLTDNFAVWLLLSALTTSVVAIIFHKAGQALMARGLGFDVTSFGLGKSRPLLVVRWGRTAFYFCARGLPDCQASVLFPDSLRKSQLRAYLAGGQLGLAAMAAGGAIGYWMYPKLAILWAIIAGYSTLAILGSEELRFAWRLWRGADTPAPPLFALGLLKRMRRLWQAIGDQRAESDALQSASEEWRLLGDAAYATALLRESEQLHPESNPTRLARWHLRRSWLLSGDGDYKAATEHFVAARRIFQEAGDVGEEIHTALQQATAAADNGDWQAVEQLLAEWRGHPKIFTDAKLRVIAWQLELAACGTRLSAEQIESIYVQYSNLYLRASLPPEVDWSMNRRLTYVWAQRQDARRAQETFRQATVAAKHIVAELPTDEDRNRFTECAKTFDRAVAALFQDDAATAWSGCIAELNFEAQLKIEAAANTQREQAATDLRRQRTRVRIAAAVLPLNALMFAGAVWVAPKTINLLSPDQTGIVGVLVLIGLWLFALLLFGLSVVGAGAYTFYYILGGHARKGAADEYFRLAVLPWPALGGLGLAAVLIAWLR